ncbi:unnamed protein product [Parascedosporium putredinis]|uniref:Uncharacterized protein n=1 Tax=Parascedosporium putredinis TaxID=1442378 RepID=A0A9P1GXR4_9PEZI|nr:unnamed protein product [Parascedosporium putredinis]CAI7990065.1 unnamed protein product [Parascedosporium putredinis]
MAATLRSFAVLFALMAVRVMADCVSYGIDYANGGQYYIDASSVQYFSFVSVFQGCTSEAVNPVLQDPNGNNYSCSTITTQPEGQQLTSTCGIPYSSMSSGVWKIIISGEQVNVQRTITLTVGLPETETVTATPTIVLGITSTPKAVTVKTTSVTQTVTNRNQGTVVVEETITRTQTDGQITSRYQTTETTLASCHYPTKKRSLKEREEAAVAAQTVTYTQTTYTVTQTVVTTVPPQTTTELALVTSTTTSQPPPSTVCNGGGQQVTVTVNPGGPGVTQTNLVYTTVHASGTVWVGETAYTTISNAASATACWRAGGWYGA